jgi:uncharacterized glyoxalase superfamily protein PhnB
MTDRPAMLIPTLRYHDAPAAVAWLQQAFGFSADMVVDGPNGTVAHAQLSLGPAVVMLGSAPQDAPPPGTGAVLGGIYVALADDAAVDAHHDRAAAAGARITRPLEDMDYGGRGYSTEDLEGHHWSFGAYRP